MTHTLYTFLNLNKVTVNFEERMYAETKGRSKIGGNLWSTHHYEHTHESVTICNNHVQFQNPLKMVSFWFESWDAGWSIADCGSR